MVEQINQFCVHCSTSMMTFFWGPGVSKENQSQTNPCLPFWWHDWELRHYPFNLGMQMSQRNNRKCLTSALEKGERNSAESLAVPRRKKRLPFVREVRWRDDTDQWVWKQIESFRSARRKEASQSRAKRRPGERGLDKERTYSPYNSVESAAAPGSAVVRQTKYRFFLKNIMTLRKSLNNISTRWRLLA